MLEIDDPADYQSITSDLNENDFVKVFGLGQASQQFTASNAFGAHNVYYATISVQKIDKCQSYQCNPSQNVTIFKK